MKTIQKHGPKNWRKISQILDNRRTADQCNQRWFRVINPDIIKGQWSKEEEKLLIESVSEHGESSWKKISSLIKGRTDIQCRHHFYQLKKENQTKIDDTKTSNSIENVKFLEEGSHKLANESEIKNPNNEIVFWSESEEELMKDPNLDLKSLSSFKNFVKGRKSIEIENFNEENSKIEKDEIETPEERFISKNEDRSSFPLLQAIDYIGMDDDDSVPILLSLASSVSNSSLISIQFQNIDSLDDRYEIEESFNFESTTTITEIKNYLLTNFWNLNNIQSFELFYQNCNLPNQMKIEQILEKFNIKENLFLIFFKINF